VAAIFSGKLFEGSIVVGQFISQPTLNMQRNWLGLRDPDLPLNVPETTTCLVLTTTTHETHYPINYTRTTEKKKTENVMV